VGTANAAIAFTKFATLEELKVRFPSTGGCPEFCVNGKIYRGIPKARLDL